MKAKILRLLAAIALVIALTAVIVPASVVMAQTTWYVDDDNCPGGTGTAADPFCTIGQAVAAANPAGGDTIIIAAGTYSPSTNGEAFEIYVDKDLTIQGAGARVTIIDAEDTDRVFDIDDCTVVMSRMTIQNGNTGGGGGGIRVEDSDVTLDSCAISSNEALKGGGIYNLGDADVRMTMTDCTVSGNHADFDGGGIHNYGEDEDVYLTMTNCTVSGNTAGDDGGGIANEAEYDDVSLTMINCTVTDNEAGDAGGGMYNHEDEDEVYLTLRCTIVFGNTATNGPDDILLGSATMTKIESIIGDPDGDADPECGCASGGAGGVLPIWVVAALWRRRRP